MTKGHLNINDYQFIPILQSTLDALEAAHPDLCLKTRNELYLESIEKTKALSSYDALPGEDKNVRKLRAVGQSLYFAPEAYYTAGAVRHVVEGIQVARGDAIKTLKDSVVKQPAAWRSAQAPSGLDKLSRDDLLASAIEQVADSFCHAASDSPVKFLVNGSKYLGRMLDAVTKADELMRQKDLANQTQSAPLSPVIVNALLNAAHRGDALGSQITAKDLALILKVTALASKKEELQLDVWEVQDLKQMMGRKIKAPWPDGAKNDNFSEAVFGDKLAQHLAKVIHHYEQDQEKNELLLSKAIHDASIDAESPEKAKAVESLSNQLCSGIKISLTAEASKVGEISFKDLVEVQLKKLFSLDASQVVSESLPANSSKTSPASQAISFNNRLLTCLAALETAPK
jgi:hypothetical protein